MVVNIYEAGCVCGGNMIPQQYSGQMKYMPGVGLPTPSGYQQQNPSNYPQAVTNISEINKLNNSLESINKNLEKLFEKFGDDYKPNVDAIASAVAVGKMIDNILDEICRDDGNEATEGDNPEENNGYDPECECCSGDCSKCDKTEESMEPKDENVESDTQNKPEPPTDVQNNTVNDEVEPEYQNLAKPVEIHEVGSIINLPYDGKVLPCLVVDSNTKYTEVFSLDCIGKYVMNENNTNKGGFDASDLKKWLNDEILSKFPKSIRDRLVAYSDGSFIRIPTEKQVFGENKYGVAESEDIKQFEPMKNIRNRVAAFIDEDGDIYFKWYWLENPNKDASTSFCDVCIYGYAYGDASDSGGVRLRFRIANR